MKFGKLQKVLVACLIVWVIIYPALFCGRLIERFNVSIACWWSVFCSRPSLSGGFAGLIDNPMVILLNGVLYVALIIFYLQRRRRTASKITDTQFDKGGTEIGGAFVEEWECDICGAHVDAKATVCPACGTEFEE